MSRTWTQEARGLRAAPIWVGGAPQRLAQGLWLPVALWLAAGTLLMLVAVLAGFDPLRAGTWARWDSGHYQTIAVDGYTLYPCDPAVWGPGSWCGNAGWFPAYPWLFGALARVGVPPHAAGVGLSWLFSLATLVLLSQTFVRGQPLGIRVWTLAFAAFLPGQLYHHAEFPLAMLAFFTVLHLWLLSRRRFASAGLAGGVAAATYPLGILLAPLSMAFALLEEPSARWRERLRRASLSGGLIAIGPLVVVLVMKLQTGSFTAYFQVQEKYGHGLHSPHSTLHTAVAPLVRESTFLHKAPPLQTLFVGLVVGLLLLYALVARRRLGATDWLLTGFTLVAWAFPLTQANLSLYRTDAALVPAAVLLRHLPPPLMVLFTVAALCLSIPMAVLFFQGRLV